MKDNIKKLYKQIEDWLEEGDIEIPTFELMHHMIQVCDFQNQWKENGYESDPSNPETINPDDLEDFNHMKKIANEDIENFKNMSEDELKEYAKKNIIEWIEEDGLSEEELAEKFEIGEGRMYETIEEHLEDIELDLVLKEFKNCFNEKY